MNKRKFSHAQIRTGVCSTAATCGILNDDEIHLLNWAIFLAI